MVVKNNKTS